MRGFTEAFPVGKRYYKRTDNYWGALRPSHQASNYRFNYDINVLQPRGLRPACFDVLNDINLGEFVEITTEDSFVFSEGPGQRTDRVQLFLIQVTDDPETPVCKERRCLPSGQDGDAWKPVLGKRR